MGKVSNLIDQFVKASLVVVVFTMLLLSVSTIPMRWFGINFLWLEPLVRHLVFITAFLGATLATGTGRHIGIEILAKYLETNDNSQALFILKKLTALLTLCALIWLFYSGYQAYSIESNYPQVAFLGIERSTLIGIIPAGFMLMLLRTLSDLLDFSKESA